jgi:hypothetical protein
MLEIQKKTLQKAIDLLDTLGCSYAIIDLDGNHFGTLQVNEPKLRKKGPLRFERGEIKRYLEQYLLNLKVGEVVAIPYDKFGGHTVQGSAASWFHHKYGNGCQTSTLNHKTSCVEVLRLK